jgi:hypothetical protein
MLVQNGYMTDAGNGAVCITEQGQQLVASSRARAHSGDGAGKQ